MFLDTVNKYNRKPRQQTPKAFEAERKFQIWKATTMALIVESLKTIDGNEYRSTIESFSSNLSQQILEVIQCFVGDSDEGISINLRNIIENSVALDRKISKLTARIEWTFQPVEGRLLFDPDCMEVDIGVATPQSGQVVDVAISPVLKKRGKSTGEDFDVADNLLKMGVACITSR